MLLGLVITILVCWFVLALVAAVGIGRAVQIAEYRQARTVVPVSIFERSDRVEAAAAAAESARITLAGA